MKKLIPILVLLILTSCATTKTHSVGNTTQKIQLNLDIDETYSIAYKTAMKMSWQITSSDSNVHGFSATTPQLMKRWEDDVNVFVETVNGQSVVTVKSKLGHKPNVDYIASYLKTIQSNK